MPILKAQSQFVCLNKNQITQHCNQSGVSILTNVFGVFMLQVEVNRRNYNSYVVIYITWLRQSCYVFTMYVFIRLARIDKTYVSYPYSVV